MQKHCKLTYAHFQLFVSRMSDLVLTFATGVEVTIYVTFATLSHCHVTNFTLSHIFTLYLFVVTLHVNLLSHCMLTFHIMFTVLEPRCDRAAWVRSRFEPQELIDVQLERQLATRYLHDVVFASTKLLYTTSFYQSLGFIAAKIE